MARTKAARRLHGEGTVYLDKTRNRWVGQAWIAGRRRKVSARTQEEAASKLGRLIHGDEFERRADRRATVAKLLEEWQEKALPGRTLAPATLEAHAWAVALWKAQIGKVKLVDLDATMVENAMGKAPMGDLSRASLVKCRSTLRQALAWAERRRMVAFNAAAAAEIPSKADGARTRTALTEKQLKKLLAVLTYHPLHPMFLLMARVGLRPGEAAGLCADAVDIRGKPPTVAVVRAVHLEKGTPVLSDTLKTTGARRVLAIPPDVVKALRPKIGTTVPVSEALLFTASDGGPLWPSTVRAELADACTAAKVPPITPNELRHTCATHLAERGLPPHRIADVLGHNTTRMVDAVYRHRPDVILGAEA